MKPQKFQAGDTVRVISEYRWKNKIGKIHSLVDDSPAGICYRVEGIETFVNITCHENELEKYWQKFAATK